MERQHVSNETRRRSTKRTDFSKAESRLGDGGIHRSKVHLFKAAEAGLLDRKPKRRPLFSTFSLGDSRNEYVNIIDITNIRRPAAWCKRDSSRPMGHCGIFQNYTVPHLDKFGRMTGYALYTWHTTPERFFFSFASTMINILWSTIKKKKNIHKDYLRDIRNLIPKVVGVFLISGDRYIIDRMLSIGPRASAKKSVRHYIKRFVSKMSDEKWFVYRHISLQIEWLYLRAARPRDKLILLSNPSVVKRSERNSIRGLNIEAFSFISERARQLSFRI